MLGLGKTPEQVATIGEKLADRSGRLLVTHCTPEAYQALRRIVPDAEYHGMARCATVERLPNRRLSGIEVICAGTSDLPVAQEAALTARLMGNDIEVTSDVGVAGIHRLFDHIAKIQAAKVLVVVAGMEGALPSVVAGLTQAPIIAVPTSVGYGASFNGLAPLLAMLNACAPGVSVVNIDNGFGAGYMAGLINAQAHGASPD